MTQSRPGALSPTEDPPKDEEAVVFLTLGTITEPGSGCHQPRPLDIDGLMQGETVATAIAIAIALATPKSCAEKVPKNFSSTDLVDQNLLV